MINGERETFSRQLHQQGSATMIVAEAIKQFCVTNWQANQFAHDSAQGFWVHCSDVLGQKIDRDKQYERLFVFFNGATEPPRHQIKTHRVIVFSDEVVGQIHDIFSHFYLLSEISRSR